MRHFPQLSSGAIVQYPLRVSHQYRTAVSEMPRGRRIGFFDGRATSVEWECRYEGISEAEADAIRQLHQECEGSLYPFVFCDPADNLVLWSEELGQQVWNKDPFLSAVGGVSDPLGGTAGFALTNSSAAAQSISQQVVIPSMFKTSFSLWIRGASGSSVSLRKGARTQMVQAGSDWRRVHAGGSAGAGDVTAFAVDVPPQSSMEVFGLSVEAQPAAGGYKRSGAKAGVHAKARFVDDELTVIATDYGQYRAMVRIVAPGDRQ